MTLRPFFSLYAGTPAMRSRAGIAASVLFVFSILIVCSPALAAEAKRVMLLHSFGSNFKPWSEYANQIRTELERQSPWPLDITEHSLVAARFSDEDPEAPFAEYLRALFAKHPLDLIVSIGAPAASFVQRHRQQMFAATPMVFTAVEQRRVRFSTLTENDTVVAVAHNLPAVIENLLAVLPGTKNVTVVNGTSPLEKFWLEEMRREFAPFDGRVEFTWTSTLSFEDVLKHAAALPPGSAIFWELMIVDAAGAVHQGDKALARLHAVSRAPIFSFDDSFFGRGLVGGPMHSVLETSQRAAEVAIRILNGEKAGDIKTPPIGFAAPKFDWREMQRWGIGESRLPPGSKIYFRDQTVWEQHRAQILLVCAAILLQGVLICWLLYEHWRRQRAEAASLQLTHELARMNRFATAGEMSAAIAHEIRQPLAAIAFAGSAGLNWLQSKAPDLSEARTALKTVIDESHRADDVIKTVRAMFRNEPAARTRIELNEVVQQVIALVSVSLSSNRIVLRTDLPAVPPPAVIADPVQMQQVVLNLIMNAIEAMSSSAHWTRVLQITTGFNQDGAVVLSVMDSGPGFDAKVAENLFRPFVTTKPNGMGMGLSICKSIIEQHGGELTATSLKPRGAMFRVALPAA